MADSAVAITAGSGTDIDTLTNAGSQHTQKVAAYHSTSGITTDADILVPKFAKISASTSGNNTLVAAVTGKKIRVLALSMVANAAVNGKFQDGASGTDLTGLFYMASTTGVVLPFNPVGWFEGTATTLLNLNLSAAVAVGGCLTYVEV